MLKCCVSRLFSFVVNRIWVRKDEILIVLTTRQFYFVLLNAHHNSLFFFFRWKMYRLLKWFCKCKFAHNFFVFCLSWIWTFGIDIILTPWVDDNAKCVLADHINPIGTGFTNTTLLTKSKGLKPPIRFNLNFTEFVVYGPTRECFIPMEMSPLPLKRFKFWPMLGIHSHEHSRFLRVPNYDICYPFYNGHLQEPVFNHERDMGVYKICDERGWGLVFFFRMINSTSDLYKEIIIIQIFFDFFLKTTYWQRAGTFQ